MNRPLVLLCAVLATAMPTPTAAQPPPDPDPATCREWGAYNFFRTASADTVAACLRAGADPVSPLDERGGTPLHHAARAAPDPAVIGILLQAGADVNGADFGGLTPLHHAARWNVNRDILAALVEAGADVTARDSHDNTPLHAAWTNPVDLPWPWQDARINPAAVEELLRAGADPLARNDRGEPADPTHCELWSTPVFLHAADAADYRSCVELGADVRATGRGGMTVLHLAAAHPDPAVTGLLLAAGAEIGARDRDGATPLHIAAKYENLPVVTVLLEAGADANTLARSGTPLHWAADYNRTAGVVEALLAAGADVNAGTESLETPLTSAAGPRGRTPVTDALLEAGADVNAGASDRHGPLHVSLRWQRADSPNDLTNDLTLQLLALGADPNARGYGGETPLYEAAAAHGPGVIRALVEAGADPTILRDDGESPLHPAAESGRPGTVIALVEAGADPDALNEDGEAPVHQAIGRGRVENVAALIEAGASVGTRNSEGDTPLHLAAAEGDAAIVSALVGAGADVNARNERGETPLHTAWARDKPAVISMLLEQGADAQAQDDRGVVPGPVCDWSDFDFRRTTVESVRGCIEAGTPLDARDDHGRTPLMRLGTSLDFGGDATEVMGMLLLEARANVNDRGERATTALHFAAGLPAQGNILVSALLERGADVNARTSFGHYPLHTAAQSRHDNEAMVSLLVEAGADVNARTARGETPLHLAVTNNNPRIAARLLELGADPNARSDSGMVADPISCEHWNTLIFFTVASAEQVSGCLAAGADIGARTERYHRDVRRGSPLLHLASATTRDGGVISVLLEAGADVSERNAWGYQPLHLAAQYGTPSMVRILLQAGAAVDARAQGYNIHYGWNWTPLHRAAGHNPDPEVVAALLEAGADPHARGYEEETPLYEAAANENPAVAALLLEAGADVNARGSTGRTPLHQAAGRNSNPEVLAVLLGAGADPLARGVFPDPRWRHGNTTPLHEAARLNSNPAIVTALIEAGTDVNTRVTRADAPIFVEGTSLMTIPERRGATPLHMAALVNRTPAVFQALVREGADLEMRDGFGRTALHVAAERNAAAFEALLELGADPEAVDDQGMTPMDYARENGALQGLEVVMRLRGTPVRRPPPGPSSAR